MSNLLFFMFKLQNLIKWHTAEAGISEEGANGVFYVHFRMPFDTSRVVGMMMYDTPCKSESITILDGSYIRAEGSANVVRPSIFKIRVAYI